MTSKRAFRILLASCVILTLAIIGGAYKINGVLEAKSANLVAVKATNAGLMQQQASLIKAKKDISDYTELFNIAKAVVPESKNQAEAVRQIVNLAAASSVGIGSITFPSSTLGTSPTGAAPATGQPSLSAPTTKAVDPKAALSQLTPVTGSPGVYVLPITITSDTNAPSSYPELIAFLDSLEQNRLTAEITTVNITPDTNSTNLFTFTLTVNTYIKP